MRFITSTGNKYLLFVLSLIVIGSSYIYILNISGSLEVHQSQEWNSKLSTFKASELLGGQQVYISLTSISSRLDTLAPTILSVLHGEILPDMIYIFLSRDKFLIDEGVTVEDLVQKAPALMTLLLNHPTLISVAFTPNIGPHRKLLPLLAKKWNDDCIIVTIDDHEIYKRNMLKSLVSGYLASNKSSVVALRTRRIAFCQGESSHVWSTADYSTASGFGQWPELGSMHHEMLMLPTGMGGVLYRPRFFHPVIFDEEFLKLTGTTDDLMFRLGALAAGTPVLALCKDEQHCDHSPEPWSSQELHGFKQVYRGVDANVLSKWEGRREALAIWNIVSNASIADQLGTRSSTSIASSRSLRSSSENEPAKVLSLGSKYNIRGGGNSANWRQSVDYLKHIGVYDFNAFIQTAILRERVEYFGRLAWPISFRLMLPRWVVSKIETESGIVLCSR